MGKIVYEITSGVPPITVDLAPLGLQNIHNDYGTYEFSGISVGNYTLTFSDSTGGGGQCEEVEIIQPCLDCPAGYYYIGDGCEKINVEATTEYLPRQIIDTRSAVEYSSRGTLLFSTWNPNGTGTYEKINTSNLYWINQGPNNFVNGPMNRSAVWVGANGVGKTIRFATCINIAVSKTYYIGVGCDNKSQIYLNGDLIINQDDGAIGAMLGLTGLNVGRSPFNYWFIYPIEIPAGRNILEGAGYNISSIAGLGVEIYNATALDLINATSDVDLGDKLIFRAKDLATQEGSFTYSASENYSGLICPPGYALVTCEGNEFCQKKTFIACGQVIAEVDDDITETQWDCSVITSWPHVSDTTLTKAHIMSTYFEPDRILSEFESIEIVRVVTTTNSRVLYDGQDLAAGRVITFNESPNIQFITNNYTENDTITDIWFTIRLVGETYTTQEVRYRYINKGCIMGSKPIAQYVSVDDTLGGTYDFSEEIVIPYNPGNQVIFQNPVGEPAEYHYMFVSLPTGRAFTILDSLDQNLTELFLFYAQDNRIGYVDNSIYRYTQPFGIGGAVNFKLTLI